MQSKEHWEQVYSSKSSTGVSWYQEHAEQSMQLIRATGLPRNGALIDVGGGASTLVDDLLAEGYRDLTVLDLSAGALATTRERLGERGQSVCWMEGDLLQAALPAAHYGLWHDRAVFHFLTDEASRQAYVAQVRHSVKPGGHVIVATFAEDGPTQCSGLPVMRYSPDALHDQFGAGFALLKQARTDHRTPFGSVQKFIYCYCRLAAS
ncbi:class I SAM-dependent methyltransferase [Methyloversatilis universalis]|uniref:class I SAM-dependent methyltransferase n=1 Tax=Methyloversatilis universalis TaxID=378211 RepID=UPI000374770C|nr:class I SAM-dependent methyltransferase [Methyloversatilis universalis]